MPIADALPVYHHSERHSLRVAATPERALAAAREVTLAELPLVRLLARLRGLRPGSGALWDSLLAAGFQPFRDDTLVLVGRPWSPRYGRRRVDDFLGFAEPGWAKMALDLRAVPDGDGARLETETRVFLTDRASRRRFAAYWLVIRPFSGLIRRLWLRAAKRRAETYALRVLIERSMDPNWLSNAYLVADEPGGTAVFVDSGAPLAPLHEAVEREGLTVTHLLTTHSHEDHVAGDDELVERYGIEIVKGPLETGGLRIQALETPGHSDDHLVFVANDIVAFTADVLFKDAVGGGPDAAPIRRSVMDVLMTLPHEVRVLPGHTEETTIGREWAENPFVLYWRGEREGIGEAVRVGGEDAELVVWSPDYDGKGKALVRFGDGRESIVGGSRVER